MKTTVADYRYRTICLRIVPVIGSPIYLTHYPRNLVMGGHTYLSSSGYDFTGYSASAALSPGMVDLEGITGLAGIGFDEISSGVFDGARCYLFATSWVAPVEDEEPITCSIMGKTTLLDSRYKIEEISLIDALNQSVGKAYTAQCGKTFGSMTYAGCKKAIGPLTVTGKLTSVASSVTFWDTARTEPADYFAGGTIQFTSGLNVGLKPLEIKTWDSVAKGIEVFEQCHYPPQAGDYYTMIPGCRKRLEDCRDKWTNIENFGGFSNIPLSSQYSQVGSQ